jgi:hypothetical protein
VHPPQAALPAGVVTQLVADDVTHWLSQQFVWLRTAQLKQTRALLGYVPTRCTGQGECISMWHARRAWATDDANKACYRSVFLIDTDQRLTADPTACSGNAQVPGELGLTSGLHNDTIKEPSAGTCERTEEGRSLPGGLGRGCIGGPLRPSTRRRRLLTCQERSPAAPLGGHHAAPLAPLRGTSAEVRDSPGLSGALAPSEAR